MDSPYRAKEFVIDGHRYMFRDIEERSAPAERTNQTASAGIAFATKTQPYRGHKGVPFLSLWRGVDWTSNFCDIMHDYKTICEMLLKGLVGYVEFTRIGIETVTIDSIARYTTHSRNFMTIVKSSLGDYKKTTSTHSTGNIF